MAGSGNTIAGSGIANRGMIVCWLSLIEVMKKYYDRQCQSHIISQLSFMHQIGNAMQLHESNEGPPFVPILENETIEKSPLPSPILA